MATAIHSVGLSKVYRSSGGVGGKLSALADVSFEVDAGEAVGLIGRNGAGKSTLLRVLSRVTRPTSGYADVYGRVGALLEVGTGFHPDLTGRENTFLSGAMLGLTRADIRHHFDEIVAFSEVEAFIDMPVKTYSSGMYARLGFAVAAHLLPDILIVDEVLAVGDLTFQAKCLGRMHSLTEHGTTVLFVSHNLLAMADLCARAIVLESGHLDYVGPTQEAISHYRMAMQPTRSSDPGTGVVFVDGRAVDTQFDVGPNARVRIDYEIDQDASTKVQPVIANVVISLPDGTPVMHLRSDLVDATFELRPGVNRFGVVIEDLSLAPGTYSLGIRMVSTSTSAPVILDSRPVVVVVTGDQRRASFLLPRHRFDAAGEATPAADAAGSIDQVHA